MMQLLRLSWFITIVTTCFLSCKKSATSSPTAVSSSGTSGIKVKYIRETFDSTINNSNLVYLEYHSNKVNKVSFGQDFLSNPNLIKYNLDYREDTINSGVVRFRGRDTLHYPMDTFDYYFDVNGRIDSMRLYIDYSSIQKVSKLRYFNYDNGGRIKSITDDISELYSRFSFDKNDNITKFTSNDGNTKVELEYDNHPNPLKGLIGLWFMKDGMQLSSMYFDNWWLLIPHYFNNNNITKYKIEHNTGWMQTYEFNYVYNSKKYPVKITNKNSGLVTIEYY